MATGRFAGALGHLVAAQHILRTAIQPTATPDTPSMVVQRVEAFGKMTVCCSVVGYLRRVVCQSIWNGRYELGRIGTLAIRQQR